MIKFDLSSGNLHERNILIDDIIIGKIVFTLGYYTYIPNEAALSSGFCHDSFILKTIANELDYLNEKQRRGIVNDNGPDHQTAY